MLFRRLLREEAIALTFAFLLIFHGVFASENSVPARPQLTECTQRGIFSCYTDCAAFFFWPDLKRNEEGGFNEEAYSRACRFFNETSVCYEGFTLCPEFMKGNFTRREEGYRALRALVCDTDVLKVAVTARSGADSDKMSTCFGEHIGFFNQIGMEYEEIPCRT